MYTPEQALLIGIQIHTAPDYLTHIITFVRDTCFTQAGVRDIANG
jgi:hypothetical protein